MNHLSTSEFENFLRGTLSPVEMLVCDTHLADCGECRTKMVHIGNMDRGVASLMDSFREYGTTHLTYDETRLLAEGKLAPMQAQLHVKTCASCAAEVSDLCEFGGTLETTPRLSAFVPASKRQSYWLGAIAAAVLVACVGTVLWHLHMDSRTVANGSHDPATRTPNVPAPLLPEEYQALLAETRTQGRLPLPLITTNHAPNESLLGPISTAPSFRLLAPIDEVTESDKPLFRWEPVDGATSYSVAVFDSHYRKAAEGKSVYGTSWRPSAALRRDESYSWSVTAHCRRGDVRSPVPPQPEARFKVMSEASAQRINAARANFPQNHLLLASLAAQSGDAGTAELELQAIPVADPDRTLAVKLLASLQAISSRGAK